MARVESGGQASDICKEPSLLIDRKGGIANIPQSLSIESGHAKLSIGHNSTWIESGLLNAAQAEELTALCEEVVFDSSLHKKYKSKETNDRFSYDISFAGKSFKVRGETEKIPNSLKKVIDFSSGVAKPLLDSYINRIKSNPKP